MAKAKDTQGLDLKGAATIGASVVTDIAGIYQTYEAGKSRRESLRHAAAMEAYNAGFRALQTDIDLKRLAETEAGLVGQARVQAGGSGFATDEGSNADVVSSIHRNVALDAAAIRVGGSAGVFQSTYQAGQYRLAADQAQTASNLRIANTLVSSASKYSQQFAKTGDK